MEKEEIKISELYTIKVGRNTIAVRIISCNQDGHWLGRNLKTNKDILIKSASQITGVYRVTRNTAAQAATESNEPAATAKLKKERATTQLGGLTAVAMVLAESGTALNCAEMVKQMLEKGYWKTDGKTPQATIYSAIIREIKEKGADARFRKTERGKFELAK